MLDMLPDRLPDSQPLPGVYPAQGERRARVALLAGCVQQALSPEINWATLRVLSRNGVEVIIPPEQGCCGALDLHAGEWLAAQIKARRNLAVFPQDVDAILTNAAGCGSGMKEYPLLFKGTPAEEGARSFAGRVQDVSVFLDRLGLLPPPPLPEPLRLAYHDACHLLHAQKVSAEPRRLLSKIPNLALVAIAEGEICCGSAGMYNLEQPEIARQLGERKARFILESGAQALAAGNIGCLVQLQRRLAEMNGGMPLWHTMEVLDMAYANG
jgi:glycolate oxidase iron-sulfur subunit